MTTSNIKSNTVLQLLAKKEQKTRKSKLLDQKSEVILPRTRFFLPTPLYQGKEAQASPCPGFN